MASISRGEGEKCLPLTASHLSLGSRTDLMPVAAQQARLLKWRPPSYRFRLPSPGSALSSRTRRSYHVFQSHWNVKGLGCCRVSQLKRTSRWEFSTGEVAMPVIDQRTLWSGWSTGMGCSPPFIVAAGQKRQCEVSTNVRYNREMENGSTEPLPLPALRSIERVSNDKMMHLLVGR